MSATVIEDVIKTTACSMAIADRSQEPPVTQHLCIPESSETIRPMKLGSSLDAPFMRLYTGGSTGKPKVWAKTPRNIFTETSYLKERFAFSEADTICATVPAYHIYGLLFTVTLPLLSGARVIKGIYTFPQEIRRAIIDHKASILVSVPLHYRTPRNSPIHDHGLRMAFSSAGPLDKADAEAFFENTETPVTEVYGSTETGGIATRCRALGEADLTPFAIVQWKITDERLCVKSDIISPDLPRDGDGYFLTGDCAQAIEADRFSLIGRTDGIVKVGGKRVDLPEIQDRIKAFPGVRDAYVLSLPTHRGRGNEIVALVEGTVDDAELRRKLSEQLEHYALPRRIKYLEKIPMLTTGKYDRPAIEALFKD